MRDELPVAIHRDRIDQLAPRRLERIGIAADQLGGPGLPARIELFLDCAEQRIVVEPVTVSRNEGVEVGALRAMRENGRVAYPNGVMPAPKARPGVDVQSYDMEPGPEQIEKLNRLIESGQFEVHIARTFTLDKAAEAHRELEKHYLGKLALRPQ